MEPASLAHAETAPLGDSATSRPQPVGPTCSSVTSTPLVNTAMGQRGRSVGWRRGTALNGPQPLCYLLTDPTQILRPVLPSCRCGFCGEKTSEELGSNCNISPLKRTSCVTSSMLLNLSDTHFPHQYNKGDVAYVAGQLRTLEKPKVKAPSTRATTSQVFNGNCKYHHS